MVCFGLMFVVGLADCLLLVTVVGLLVLFGGVGFVAIVG